MIKVSAGLIPSEALSLACKWSSLCVLTWSSLCVCLCSNLLFLKETVILGLSHPHFTLTASLKALHLHKGTL